MPTSRPKPLRRSRQRTESFASDCWTVVARGAASPRRQAGAPTWEHCVIVRAPLDPPAGSDAGAWRFVAAVEPNGAGWAACSEPLRGDGSYVDPSVRAGFDALTLRLTADGWNLARAATASEPWHAWRFRRRRSGPPVGRRDDR